MGIPRSLRDAIGRRTQATHRTSLSTYRTYSNTNRAELLFVDGEQTMIANATKYPKPSQRTKSITTGRILGLG